MKIDFIIISGILVILSFLPFILLPLLISNAEKRFQQQFKDAAAGLGLNISYKLSWNKNLAGIDLLNRHFLLVQVVDKEIVKQHLNLKNVQQIKLVTENRAVEGKKKFTEILSRVDLEFYENMVAEPLKVNLFNYDLNYIEDFEIKNAQKLVTELQKYVVSQPVLKRTA